MCIQSRKVCFDGKRISPDSRIISYAFPEVSMMFRHHRINKGAIEHQFTLLC